MYRLIKSVADAVVRRLAQARPVWHDGPAEQSFAAQPSYQPTPPVNFAALPTALRRRFAAPVPLPAHRVYQLRNVHVTWDGAVFQNLRVFGPSVVQPGFVGRFQDTLLLRQWLGCKVPVAIVAVCHDQWSVENYYHWLIDTLPRLLVLRQRHPDILLLLPQPLPPRLRPDYQAQSAAALGFGNYLAVDAAHVVRAGTVVLPALTAPSLGQHPALVRLVRAELLAALAPVPALATRKIYAARRQGGVRGLVNGVAVEALLAEAGFEKVYFEDLTFLEQIALMRTTTVLLGIHGAGMVNMLFLPGTARVAELLNADYGDPCYGHLASCLGLTYFCLPATGIQPALQNQSDLVVDVALLRQTLRLVLETRN